MKSPPTNDDRRTLANQRARINLLLAMNAVTNLHLRDARRAIEDKERHFVQQLDAIGAEINDLKDQREKMLASASWRITAPLRGIRACLERWRR